VSLSPLPLDPVAQILRFAYRRGCAIQESIAQQDGEQATGQAEQPEPAPQASFTKSNSHNEITSSGGKE
jgi:hypothetical protein